MKDADLSWMIGGAQGSGVDSSANTFARACAFGGLHLFGKREYYSNIKGEHSYFQVRVAPRPIRSHVDTVHLLATFDAETAFRHFQEVVKGGAILYDPTLAATKLGDIPTIEARLEADLRAFFAEQGVGERLDDALKTAAARGVLLAPVPFQEILGEVAKAHGVEQLSKISRMVNLIAVGASLGLLEYESELLVKAIHATFRAKAKVAEMNVDGARRAYEFARARFASQYPHRLSAVPAEERRILLGGSQAIAMGKLMGGCRFQTYYPITPASDESEYLEAHERFDLQPSAAGDDGTSGSILVVQTEDEIAAVTMATGAALSGARSSTSTSGPGFSLMMEGLGWAGINEVPLVVTLYQRGGPSTGLPTRHEQGDLQFALHAGHGEFPRIVFASADLEECFLDAARSFNYAERYQLPVIHLVDKALANSTSTVPWLLPNGYRIDRGNMVGDAHVAVTKDRYRRFEFTPNGLSPRAPLGAPGTIFWNTGDEHDEFGHITEDPVLRTKMMDKRMGKLELAAAEIPEEEKVRYHGPRDADTVLVSWGSTKGAILDAMETLRAAGHVVGFLQVRFLSPFPTDLVTRALAKASTRVAVEMNYSAQLAHLVREQTGLAMTHFVVKYNGRPMSCEEVTEAVTAILRGNAPTRQVLNRGA